MSELDDFLRLCADEISRRANLPVAEPALASGAHAFQMALDQSTPLEAEMTTVPVVGRLGEMSDSSLVAAGCAASAQIPWVPTHRDPEDAGRTIALALVNEVRDLGTLTCGLMLLAPEAAYPEHSHPPQEIYLQISSGGSWRYGGSGQYEFLDGDTLVYNRPGDRHGARASYEPLLAMYILWP